jgi:hypothetical protein
LASNDPMYRQPIGGPTMLSGEPSRDLRRTCFGPTIPVNSSLMEQDQ